MPLKYHETSFVVRLVKKSSLGLEGAVAKQVWHKVKTLESNFWGDKRRPYANYPYSPLKSAIMNTPRNNRTDSRSNKIPKSKTNISSRSTPIFQSSTVSPPDAHSWWDSNSRRYPHPFPTPRYTPYSVSQVVFKHRYRFAPTPSWILAKRTAFFKKFLLFKKKLLKTYPVGNSFRFLWDNENGMMRPEWACICLGRSPQG